MCYVDGCVIKPVLFKVDVKMHMVLKPDGMLPMQMEIDELDKRINEYFQKDSLIKQQIFSTIMDCLLLHVYSLSHELCHCTPKSFSQSLGYIFWLCHCWWKALLCFSDSQIQLLLIYTCSYTNWYISKTCLWQDTRDFLAWSEFSWRRENDVVCTDTVVQAMGWWDL